MLPRTNLIRVVSSNAVTKSSGSSLFGSGTEHVLGHLEVNPSAFALVGMGAFLAAATHAPIMAIIMIFEITLDYQIILPRMLACVVAYYTSASIEKQSIYAEALNEKARAIIASSSRNFMFMTSLNRYR